MPKSFNIPKKLLRLIFAITLGNFNFLAYIDMIIFSSSILVNAIQESVVSIPSSTNKS